jgi:hypothetical protein
MLWLIWIVMMLLTPLVAGVGVWRQVRLNPREIAPGTPNQDNR